MAYTENPSEALIDAALSTAFVALFWPLLARVGSVLSGGAGSPPPAAVAVGATAIVMAVIWYDGRYMVD